LVDFVDVDDAPLAFRDVEFTGLEQPHQDVLHVLTDIAGFGQGGGVSDGEGNIENACEGLGQERLADSGRADQQDIGLIQLDPVVPGGPGVDALVVVINGNGQGSL